MAGCSFNESDFFMQLRALAAATLVIPALLLAACGGSHAESDNASSPSDNQASTSDSDSGDDDGSAADAPDAAPDEEPASTAVADAVDPATLPQVSGEIGDKPTITVPDNDAPDSLQRLELIAGDGPVSEPGDWVQVNYLGQVWGGEVFDNSYDRGDAFTVQVGMDQQRQVVAGWDVGLVGVQAGSRILLSFPPRDGYGAQGSPPAIGGDDTLIFVIDVLGVYGIDSFADAAGPQTLPDSSWPTVSGELGEVPQLTIPTGEAAPTDTDFFVLAEGDGDPVQAGQVLMQYKVASWDGEITEQTWVDATGQDPNAGAGPIPFPVMDGTPFNELVGVPIGSRVLMVTAANEESGVPAAAWVIDIIAQHSAVA